MSRMTIIVRLGVIGAVLLGIFSLSGCATLGPYNPATGRKEFIIIPTDTEVAMGQNIHSQIQREFRLSQNSPEFNRVQKIGQRLARVSDRQDYEYHFYMIDKEDINAFTTPGGNIYFFTGLFNKLTTDDEIASVLAHEIGHCAARHTIKKYQAQLGFNLIGSLIFSQVSQEARDTVAMASNMAVDLAMTAYSRHDEYEADRLGIKYMSLAGYDLSGMIKTLKILEVESHGARPPVFLSTHPYIEDRIKAAEVEIQNVSRQNQESQSNE